MTSTRFPATLRRLIEDPTAAGIRYLTRYDSATGPTVTPPAGTLRATGDHPHDVAGEFTLADGTQAVSIDSWGSQASRMEAAAERLADRVGLPLVRLVGSKGEVLTTSFRLSHRHADATWRACRADLEAAGLPFLAIQDATVAAADPLVRWFPTAPLFGWWHSHTTAATNAEADKRRVERIKAVDDATLVNALPDYARLHEDARSARVVTAEIVAHDVHRRLRMPAKVDTLFGPLKGVAGEGGKSKGPSALGLGSLPPVRQNRAPVDVTFGSIEGYWYLSLPGLRRFTFEAIDPDVAHPLLVCLALLLRESTERESRLRAGAELVVAPDGRRAEIVRHGQAGSPFSPPPFDELCEIVRELGQAVGWSGPVDVQLGPDSVIERVLHRAERGDADE